MANAGSMQNLFYNSHEIPQGPLSHSDRFHGRQSPNEMMEDQESSSMNRNDWQATSRSTEPRNERGTRYLFKQKPHIMSKFSNVKHNKDMMDVDSQVSEAYSSDYQSSKSNN